MSRIIFSELNTISKSFNGVQIEFVRWRRKPRWLPTAKSKLFRVPPRLKLPEDERVELKRLYDNYHTQMKSIRSYLHRQYNVQSVTVDAEEQMRLFEKEFIECMTINEAWNAERAAEREKRLQREEEIALRIANERKEMREKRMFEQLLAAEEAVKQEKEASKTYITPENLDEVIEKVLSKPVDYNFAIDLDGNRYYDVPPKKDDVK